MGRVIVICGVTVTGGFTVTITVRVLVRVSVKPARFLKLTLNHGFEPPKGEAISTVACSNPCPRMDGPPCTLPLLVAWWRSPTKLPYY